MNGHIHSAFPELSREQLEQLCLKQNQRVAVLLEALQQAIICFEKDGTASAAASLNTIGRAAAALATERNAR
jgi:hypothetical protein